MLPEPEGLEAPGHFLMRIYMEMLKNDNFSYLSFDKVNVYIFYH